MTTKRARELIEGATGPEDGLGLFRARVQEIPRLILSEAWSAGRKKEIAASAAIKGLHIVDHIVVGDYDLVLWHSAHTQGFDHLYLVSINNAEHSPHEANAQMAKYKGGSIFPQRAIKHKLVEWVNHYGSVIVGSHVPERNELYYKMVKRLLPAYTLAPWWDDDLTYGFRLSK